MIHADGNGLGQIFLSFDKDLAAPAGPDSLKANRTYLDKLRQFSLALDDCTERAFCKALQKLKPKRGVLPIVPLVLGGDDLTVVCDGRQAMAFIQAFIEAFEEETKSNTHIATAMERVSGRDFISSCAGLAIVKPHFPFYAAYTLAENLLREAKTHKPSSAIDFHVLYDASGPDLKRIRAHLLVDNRKTKLVARPYVISGPEKTRRHGVDALTARLKALTAVDDDGRRLIPNSVLHDLREGLFHGRGDADQRLKLALGRHDPKSFGPLIDGSENSGYTLFWKGDSDIYYTGLLDAMDLAEFWEK